MTINELLYDMNAVHNVVWRVSGLADYQRILHAFLRKANMTGTPVCYIHFANQQLTRAESSNVRILDLQLTHRFEAFSTSVYRAIQNEKPHTLFIFDSLSELQTAWATDLMMENFFRVVTPMIRERRCKAFFPLIRQMHSAEAGEDIMEETEIFLDLYSDFKDLFLRPMKESSETEGKPYVFRSQDGLFLPIDRGPLSARFLRTVNSETMRSAGENRDAWERYFDRAQRLFRSGRNLDAEMKRMSEIMMSRDEKIRGLLLKHFKPVDYFSVREHMVGTGLIGGKACGMLIARKIVENNRPDIYEHFEAHDSFFIGSDVFYSYIVDNNYWQLRVRQRTDEGYFALADEFAEKLRTGTFSKKLEKEFIRVLDYYGECPIIVRSSSILEDGFGNAFAGKYDSVFCMGKGSLEERLAEFENAIRIVYASTMSRSALDYRLRRGLNNRDEQMSLLVMRVSGSFYGDYYFPCAAGVGYSYSTYRFLKELDPSAGMLRLVMGLGTSAVDRTEGSYPRLVSLDRPQATSFKSQAEHHRYSQRRAEVINTKEGTFERIDPALLYPLLSYKKKSLLFEHDLEAENRFLNRGQRRDITFVSCPGLVKDTSLMKDMRELMQTIQEEYDQPVDIEFTINPDAKGQCMINLLQCRPLQIFQDTARQEIPTDLDPETVLLDCCHTSMGMSQATPIDYLVYVDPIAYYNMPYNDKQQVAKAIGRINWQLRDLGKKLLLFAPGRLGTSSPELGVPTIFSDISEFTGIFEIAESKAGYNPELSYGSHMFQDLVENQILYAAVFENESTRLYRPGLLKNLPNVLSELDDESRSLTDILKVYDMTGWACCLYHDMLHEHLVITLTEKEAD